MDKETYNKLSGIDYSRIHKQISDLIKKYDLYNLDNRGRRIEREPWYCDVMGFASIIFFMMIDASINSFDDYEMSFEKEISKELQLYNVRMNQECIGIFVEQLGKEQRKKLFSELKECANSMDYDELVAFILFGDVAEEDNMLCIKTPRAISQLASELLEIKTGDCVADFSSGEKNFVSDIYIENQGANYKFFNINEEMFNVFYYLRYALLGIKVTNDILVSMYDEDVEAPLCDKAFLDYCEKLQEAPFTYPFDVVGISKEWKYAYRIVQLLKKSGKAAVVIPNVCTTSMKDECARKWFLSQGYIEAVIALPEKMYKGTSASFTMILLSHNNSKVTFVNATEKGQMIRNGAKRMNGFSEKVIEEIADAVKGISSFGTKVLVENIYKNSSILSPNTYCIEAKACLDGIEFQKVIRNISRGVQIPSSDIDRMISEFPTEYKYLTPANITNGVIQEKLMYLMNLDEKQKKYMARENDLVISKNAEPFKVALVEENNLLISSNLYKVEIDTDKISPLYLKGYLESEVGQAELKRASSGGVIATLGVEAIKRIKISCPPLKEQEKVVKEYQRISKDVLKKQQEVEELLVKRKSLFI